MSLDFFYPVVIYYGDDPDDCIIKNCCGKISNMQLSHEPYQIDLTAEDLCVTVLFGYYQPGWFLCIPGRNFGSDISHPSDIFQNIELLSEDIHRLDYEDATAVAYALKRISKCIKI